MAKPKATKANPPVKNANTNGNVSSGAVKGLDLNSLGSAEVLRIADINVDEDYQRDLRHSLVNEIGRDYDIVKAGPILVNEWLAANETDPDVDREDGSLWAVDGQHRMAGGLQAGEEEIFSHVVHGLTRAQEAELRLARNNRKGDTQQEKWKTRRVMGDPKVHAIDEIVIQHNAEINLIPTANKGINAIATVELLYDIDGTGVWLGRTLKAIDEAYDREPDPQAPTYWHMNPITLSTSMLKAVCWFLGQHVDHKQMTEREFIERMGQFGVDDINRKARSHKAANGGSLWLNYYRALVEVWNFRRQEAKKIHWKTVGSIQQLGAQGVRRDGFEQLREKHDQR